MRLILESRRYMPARPLRVKHQIHYTRNINILIYKSTAQACSCTNVKYYASTWATCNRILIYLFHQLHRYFDRRPWLWISTVCTEQIFLLYLVKLLPAATYVSFFYFFLIFCETNYVLLLLWLFNLQSVTLFSHYATPPHEMATVPYVFRKTYLILYLLQKMLKLKML